jgi:preprotein translocase subunit SecG
LKFAKRHGIIKCRIREKQAGAFYRKGLKQMELAITIIQLLAGLFLTAVILLQSGKRSGLSGAISGGADTFLSGKGGSKKLDAKLAKMTKWVALIFVVLTLVLNLI